MIVQMRSDGCLKKGGNKGGTEKLNFLIHSMGKHLKERNQRSFPSSMLWQTSGVMQKTRKETVLQDNIKTYITHHGRYY